MVMRIKDSRYKYFRMPTASKVTKKATRNKKASTRKVTDYPALIELLEGYADRIIAIGFEDNRAVRRGSDYTYGFNNGATYGILLTLKLPIILLPPQKWQHWINPTFKPIKIKDEMGKTETLGFKSIALQEAKKIYPNEDFIPKDCRSPQDGIVDTALILECVRRMFTGSTGTQASLFSGE